MKQELFDFHTAWNKALERNDAAETGGFMHVDWVCVGADGRTSKADFLGSISSSDLKHSIMSTEDPEAKIYGNTGILTSRGVSAGVYKGQSIHLYEWQSSIFVLENGKWGCVLTMLTPANKTE